MRMVRRFNQSTGVLLLATGLALFLSNWAGAELASPQDPLLLIPVRTLHWVIGLVGLILAGVCLFGSRAFLQTTVVLWLAVNFWIYVFGLRWSGVPNMQAALGSFPEAFGLSRGTAAFLVQGVFGYLLLGSLLIMSWLWIHGRQAGKSDESRDLRLSCVHCGGHIAFPATRTGQKISCPHCEKAITLRKPENLKMSCYFCKGHIEFPSHAIGNKLPCPHCQMDITLIEPK